MAGSVAGGVAGSRTVGVRGSTVGAAGSVAAGGVEGAAVVAGVSEPAIASPGASSATIRSSVLKRRGVAGGPPGERDPLDRRQVRQDGQHPQRRLQLIEQGAGDQADHALRALHHAHRAPHADRLGPRLRVAHHHRADEPGHRHDGAARVGHLREEHDDAQQHDEIGVPVDDRIEERAERRDLAGGARQRAVQEVAETGQDEQPARAARPARDERRRRQEAHAEAEDGQVVRAQAEPSIEHEPDRLDPGAHGLAVAAEHLRSAASGPVRGPPARARARRGPRSSGLGGRARRRCPPRDRSPSRSAPSRCPARGPRACG